MKVGIFKISVEEISQFVYTYVFACATEAKNLAIGDLFIIYKKSIIFW